MRSDRRQFLKASSLMTLGAMTPSVLAESLCGAGTSQGENVLVVIQLDGGNDGINTVVPFRDPGYARARKNLRIPDARLLKVNGDVGLHPSLEPFVKLLEQDCLTIVQGVGYPTPSRSHFVSMDVWHHARLDPEDHTGTGWLGRAMDYEASRAGGGNNRDAPALFVGGGMAPSAIRGARAAASSVDRIEDFLLEPGVDPRKALAGAGGGDVAAFVQQSLVEACGASDRMAGIVARNRGDDRYPTYELGTRLRLVSQLLKAGHGARVFYLSHGGFDTHAAQLDTHASLLSRLARSIGVFMEDMTASKIADRVTILVFSEFGRTVKENASNGTDHGSAGPVFVVGSRLRQPLIGTAPNLEDLVDGEPKAGLDFRRIYASVLKDVLGVPTKAVLPGWEPLHLFKGD